MLVDCTAHNPQHKRSYCYEQADGSHATHAMCSCGPGVDDLAENCPIDDHRLRWIQTHPQWE